MQSNGESETVEEETEGCLKGVILHEEEVEEAIDVKDELEIKTEDPAEILEEKQNCEDIETEKQNGNSHTSELEETLEGCDEPKNKDEILEKYKKLKEENEKLKEMIAKLTEERVNILKFIYVTFKKYLIPEYNNVNTDPVI